MNTVVESGAKAVPLDWKPHPPLTNLPFKLGHLRLGYRWSRYLLWSARKGHPTGVKTALQSLATLGWLSLGEVAGGARKVECNVCGWGGSTFYPNCGPGYYEENNTCPRCSCIGRYRALTALLDVETDFFSPAKGVLEVAPVRTFQAYSLWRKNGSNYLSFDLERFGMEKGDLTALRHADNSFDYFLCFHVLEHVPADVKRCARFSACCAPEARRRCRCPSIIRSPTPSSMAGPTRLKRTMCGDIPPRVSANGWRARALLSARSV